MELKLDNIYHVLDFLTKDAASIFNCSLVNSEWRSIIIKYGKKFLKTKEMFVYLYSFPNSKLKAIKKINDGLSIIKISNWSNSNIEKYKNNRDNKKEMISKIKMIPNYFVNGIKENNGLWESVAQHELKKYFIDLNDFSSGLWEITSKRKNKTIIIYIKYYKNSDYLNKIVWLSVLLLFTDEEIECIYKRK